MARALLLTGPPGIGKTTVIRRVAAGLPSDEVCGFLTEEIRDRSGRRTGFLARAFDGREVIIAELGIEGAPRVGRYGIDVEAVDSLADTLDYREPGRCVFIVDEIGRMECLSPRFVGAMRRLLDSPAVVVATVALRGGPFVAEVKQRPDVKIWSVAYRNRDSLVSEVLSWISSQRTAGG